MAANTFSKQIDLLENRNENYKTTIAKYSGQAGIWLSAEDRDVMPNGKDLMFDYYSSDYDMYDVGINIELMDLLKNHGYYAEWNDAGTVLLWPVNR